MPRSTKRFIRISSCSTYVTIQLTITDTITTDRSFRRSSDRSIFYIFFFFPPWKRTEWPRVEIFREPLATISVAKLTFRRARAIVYRPRVFDARLQNGHAYAITKCARVVCQKTKGKIGGRRHRGFFFDRYNGIVVVGNRPRIRDHGPKEQGESVYKTWETCPAFVRPRKRILYRTRIDDTDFLSFSVLIRLIAAYKYSIIRVIECCSMTLGGDAAGRETKETFVLLPRENRRRLPFLPYFFFRAECNSPPVNTIFIYVGKRWSKRSVR